MGATVAREVGVIVFLARARGYGFARGPNGRQYFVHRSACSGWFDAFEVGDRISFEAHETERGPRASRVQPED